MTLSRWPDSVKPRWSGLNPLSAEPPVALTWAGKVQKEQETPPHREGSTDRDGSFLGAVVSYCVCYQLSPVGLFATPWTVTRQAPLSMGISRQKYWSVRAPDGHSSEN